MAGYAAPEVEYGSYTCQSDVYSLGVVMLELLTGRRPFDRLAYTKVTTDGTHKRFWTQKRTCLTHLCFFLQDKAEGTSNTSSVGDSSASWHRCVDKNGWPVTTRSVSNEIIVTFCSYHITFTAGKVHFIHHQTKWENNDTDSFWLLCLIIFVYRWNQDSDRRFQRLSKIFNIWSKIYNLSWMEMSYDHPHVTY